MTERCVRSCPYCFAKQHMEESENERVSWDDYIYVLDFHESSGIKDISLLGGEPTTHPEIVPMVEYALKRGFRIKLFTSGIMPEAKLNGLAEVIERNKAQESVRFICNVNEPKYNKPKEWELIEKFFLKLGPRIVQGFNIFEPAFDMMFLFHNIERYGLKNNIRIGITHKILSDDNSFISPEQYPAIVKRMKHFLPFASAARAQFNIDCGLPMCAFSDEDLGIFTKAGTQFSWSCGPIPDIGPDLKIWPCFPLSSMNEKTLYDFNKLSEIHEYYFKMIGELKKNTRGIYAECDTCRLYEEKRCSGGCHSYVISC